MGWEEWTAGGEGSSQWGGLGMWRTAVGGRRNARVHAAAIYPQYHDGEEELEASYGEVD